MDRRRLLSSLAAGATLPLLGQRAQPIVPAYPPPHAGGVRLAITAVEVIELQGHRIADPGIDDQFQVRAEHVYDALRPPSYVEHPGPKQRLPITASYLRLRTDAGLDGMYGPIDGNVPRALRSLRMFLLGKDALAGETLWDEMYRVNPMNRDGDRMMALSAIDCALWDLRAKFYGVPVYRLLGGPSRDAVEVYASCLGYSVEPASVRRHALEVKAMGYRHQKWFMPYGPGSGAEGLEKNVELVRVLRETLGEDTDLMFDAFTGWDLGYALQWAERVEPYRPRWIEEPMSSDRLDGFVTLSQKTRIPVAAGEHFYTRWDVAHMLEARAINVVQADPDWCGGISELVKIGTLASIYDVPVVPHGHSVHAALHVIASQSPGTFSMAEYLLTRMPAFYHFEKAPPVPVHGRIALPQRPGFGIELKAEVIESQRVISD